MLLNNNGVKMFMLIWLASFALWNNLALAADSLDKILIQELQKRYHGAKIELSGEYNWLRGVPLIDVDSISVLEDNLQGKVSFRASNNGEISEGCIGFSAWISAPVAARRILPGERLSPQLFTLQSINIATGVARDFRGVILPKDTVFTSLEAKQTILEGQYPLTTGVQKIPDVRRGELVRIKVVSGSLVLSTTGVTSEPAYINSPIHVVTSKTKRELIGKLGVDGVVEVNL